MARTRHVRIRLIVPLCAAVLLVVTAGCSPAPQRVVLATTSSVGNSGLLDAVLPHYQLPVHSLLVGSGRAIEMLAAGQADVVISHAPSRETEALRQHPRWFYRKILFNDFLLVGPSEDPAKVGGAGSAAEALRRIAAHASVFLSRGDESGTHERERELWDAAGGPPPPDRLVVAGAGMGQTLRIASSSGAYTLTDRGTFETLKGSLRLVPLFAGDPTLLNTYAVIADGERAQGLAFASWLSQGEGRRVLEAALGDRVRGFTLWPPATPADQPGALPAPR